ncbi:MAG: hypothetical protein ABW193_12580 [Luteibacter sp.]
MRITRITLPSVDVEACVAFFRDVMQLPVEGRTVRVGWTAIELVASSADTGAVHLAFNVAPRRFGAACAWLSERAMLLRDPMGEDRFRIDGAWQSESVYFAGPHDAVLELIARDPLDDGDVPDGAFHGGEIACVSEVGLPTDDVPALVRDLVTRFGLVPFGDVSDAFAPLGGHDALLIVVDRDRRWFPEGRRLPGALGLRVTLEGPMPSGHFADANGWLLTTRAAIARGAGSPVHVGSALARE